MTVTTVAAQNQTMTQHSAQPEELTPAPDAPAETETAMQEIELLLDELAGWITQHKDRADFYGGLLDRLVSATEASAAAIWVPAPDQKIALSYHSQIQSVYGSRPRLLIEQDQQLIESAQASGAATVVSSDQRSDGPIFIHPLTVLDECRGSLVLYFDPETPQRVARAFMPLIEAFVELIVDYEKDRQLRSVNDRLNELSQLLSISMSVHGKKRKRAVAYELANDGRVFLGIDRLTVFRRGLWSDRVLASSGLARVDDRSNVLRSMRKLVTQTCNFGSSVVFFGDHSTVPAGLQRVVGQYLGDHETGLLAVVPIHLQRDHRTDREEEKPRRRDTIGAMVLEHGPPVDAMATSQKLDLLTQQATSALSQAERYERIPFRWLWESLSTVLGWFAIDRFARTAIVFLLLAAVAAAAVFYKTDFDIEVNGQLRPVDERYVFAMIDGEIEAVLVRHGQQVQKDELLLTLTSPELDKELNEIRGQFESLQSRINSLEIAMRQAGLGDQDPQLTQAQLAANIEELTEQRNTLTNRQQFLLDEKKKLEIRSPIAGQVVTWNVEQRLISRPVRKGDSVMKIADTQGRWHVEFEIPDRKMGYVLDRQEEQGRAANVDFIVATAPDRTLTGTLQKISNVTFVNDQQQPVVRTNCEFDNRQLQERRVGAEVIGKIDCGRRNAVYVWTYEFLDAIKRRFFY